eukprot:m51a1_g3960 hypothetical protein (237) ;mRNA; r:362984-367826
MEKQQQQQQQAVAVAVTTEQQQRCPGSKRGAKSRSKKRLVPASDLHGAHMAAQSEVFRRARALAAHHEAEVMVVVVAKRGDVFTLSSPHMRELGSAEIMLPLLNAYGLLQPGTYVPPFQQFVEQTYHVRVEAVGARGTLALARAPVVVGTVRIPRSAKQSNSVAVADSAEGLDAANSNAQAEQQQQHEEELGQSQARSKSCAGRSHDCSSSGSDSEATTNLKASRECRPPLVDLLA